MKQGPIEPPAEPNPNTPEARRRRAALGLGTEVFRTRLGQHLAGGSRTLTVLKRVAVGTYEDGFIHAGNLAYMAILALFPFFIVIAAIFTALGEASEREASVRAFLSAAPPMVSKVIAPVALTAMNARSGWLLWVGGAVGLWTVSSLVETIRDILRRAYGTPQTAGFWRHRLLSGGFIVGAVIILLLSLFAQVAITAAQEVIAAWFPRLDAWALTLTTSRLVPAGMLYLSIYILFLTLTPSAYRSRAYPKWPGALLVTVWWVAVTVVLPSVLRRFFHYDLTYGSLAGVMIALFFFWLVGLGMVTGAELNAALVETPEERDALGQSDNKARRGRKSNGTIDE